VLGPLSNVICYFSIDLGGLEGVATLLAQYVVENRHNSFSVLPRILIFINSTNSRFNSDTAVRHVYKLIKINLESQTQTSTMLQTVKSSFYSIQVFNSGNMNATDRSDMIHRTILESSQAAKEVRSMLRFQFTFDHLEALFNTLLDQFSVQDPVPFSLIRASRSEGFDCSNFSKHLFDFINLIASEAWLWHFIAPIAASAILLASYPPGSHSMSHSIKLGRELT
jgi:hypothetical protein